MKKKAVIHQFDPVIYPFKLWVGKDPTFEEVSEMFYAVSPEMERMDIKRVDYDDNYFSVARTHPVAAKKDGWIGLLVCIFKPKRMNAGLVCHESVHVADFICEQVGVTHTGFNDGEAYAYLSEWAANCIDKVRRGVE